MDELKKAWFNLKKVMVANYGQRKEMDEFERLLMGYEPLPPIPEAVVEQKDPKMSRRKKKEYVVNNMDEDQIPANVWEDNEKGEGSD